MNFKNSFIILLLLILLFSICSVSANQDLNDTITKGDSAIEITPVNEEITYLNSEDNLSNDKLLKSTPPD